MGRCASIPERQLRAVEGDLDLVVLLPLDVGRRPRLEAEELELVPARLLLLVVAHGYDPLWLAADAQVRVDRELFDAVAVALPRRNYAFHRPHGIELPIDPPECRTLFGLHASGVSSEGTSKARAARSPSAFGASSLVISLNCAIPARADSVPALRISSI